MRPPASVRRPPVAPQGHCRRSQGTAGRYGLHTLRLREQVPRVRRSRGLEFGTRWRRFGRAPSPAETHDIPTARGWTRPARHSRAAARVGALVCVEAERRRWRAGWRLAPRAPRARAERDSHEIAWAGARFGQGHETRRRCPAAARVNAELPRRARRVATRERAGIAGPGLRIRRCVRGCCFENSLCVLAHRAAVGDALRAGIVTARSARVDVAACRAAGSARRNDRPHEHESETPPNQLGCPFESLPMRFRRNQGAQRPVTT